MNCFCFFISVLFGSVKGLERLVSSMEEVDGLVVFFFFFVGVDVVDGKAFEVRGMLGNFI